MELTAYGVAHCVRIEAARQSLVLLMWCPVLELPSCLSVLNNSLGATLVRSLVTD